MPHANLSKTGNSDVLAWAAASCSFMEMLQCMLVTVGLACPPAAEPAGSGIKKGALGTPTVPQWGRQTSLLSREILSHSKSYQAQAYHKVKGGFPSSRFPFSYRENNH